jgi:multidrug efflux pump subunit AcrA (membrane-fusion protein)
LAQVKIKDYEKKDAISIPVNLLQNDEKGKFVYVAVVEGGKMIARKKIVATGEFYGNNIEVLSGLAAGEILITEGYQSIYDGQLITKTIK